MTVVFQRVVRAPPRCPVKGGWILALVEGLQESWPMPERLPMPYERTSIDTNDDDNDDDVAHQNDGTILFIDSPLSPDAAYTRLYLQVVGVLEHDMCIVVVQKQKENHPSHDDHDGRRPKKATSSKSAAPSFPAMMKSLFDDAEGKIIKSLDNYLHKFSAGMIPIDDFRADEEEEDQESPIKVPTVAEHQQAMMEALLETGTSIIDAEIVTEDDIVTTTTVSPEKLTDNAVRPTLKEQQPQPPPPDPAKVAAAVWETMRRPASQQPVETGDFAVRAAKKATLQRTTTNEFAVASAAKKKQRTTTTRTTANAVDAAAAATTKQPVKSADSTTTPKQQQQQAAAAAVANHPPPEMLEASAMNWMAIRPPMLDPAISGVKRTFQQTISRPEDYVPGRRRHTGTTTAATVATTTTTNNNKPSTTMNNGTKAAERAVTSNSENMKQQQQTLPLIDEAETDTTTTPSSQHTTEKILDAPIDAWIPSVPKGTAKETEADEITASKTVKQQLQQQQRKLNLVTMEERDPVLMPRETIISDDPGIQSMQEALDAMIEQTKEMTPEELLQDVMNFGEKLEREEKRGFVLGAFATAKELLRLKQQKENNDPKKKQPSVAVRELTPDEALKEMFQAGERLAEGRITRKESQRATFSPEEDELIDSLIASDKAVSRHARVLDDGLAELEVMIQRSPGEEFDDVTKRKPLFDVMSGPEVYNPNVDPKTAVNWPGALPGTRDLKLPKELDEAVKQAKFAADVLMKVKESIGADGKTQFKLGMHIIAPDQISKLRVVVDDAVQIGLIDDPLELMSEESRLQMLIDELWTQPDERTREIVCNYKDLLLSEYFVAHVKKRLELMALRDVDALRKDDTSVEEVHQRERDILGQLVSYTQLLVKETRALGAELEASQLEVIRSICKVAMDPSLKTEEETAMALTDAVRDMRPLFDDMFIAYLKYAVAEEEGKLARAGTLDDPAANEWLFVLKIVQQGVYKEISKSINRYLDHIWYILRMETPTERRMLLEMLVNDMPTLDVRPFVQVVENIAGSLGQSAKGDFDGATPLGEMTNKVLQLYRDVREILPPERIAEKSRVADEWAARQRKRLMDQRQMTRQRIQASQDTEHLEDEIAAMDKRGGGDDDSDLDEFD
jgi:hypothetical protein